MSSLASRRLPGGAGSGMNGRTWWAPAQRTGRAGRAGRPRDKGAGQGLATILQSVLPLFTLILLGFAAGRVKLIDAVGLRALITFVFNFAMPPLLFRLVVKSDVVHLFDLRFVLCHVGGQALVAAASVLLAAWLLRLDRPALVIQGFGAAFPNSVLLGLPLMITLYGERGALPATVIFATNVALYSLVTLLLELTSRAEGAGGPGQLLRGMLIAIFGNPIIAAACLGLVVALAGLPLPRLVDRTLALLGQAGPATALFALGASLSVRALSGRWGAPAVMVGCKLLLHPLLAWLLAVPLLGLDPFLARAAIIMAALPVGANVYVFAQQYEVAVEAASSAILISTGLAMLSLPVVLWLVL